MNMTSSQDFETDVVVVGAGAAGMTAALVAASEGLQVLLLEKSPVVGGCTTYSAGVCWVPGNHLAEAAGVQDPPENVRRYMEACIGEHLDRERVERYLALAPPAFQYLEAHSEVRFALRAMCDYYPELPGGSQHGRPLESLAFDGQRLGPALAHLRMPPPEFLVWGGMMVTGGDATQLMAWKQSWKGFTHAVKLSTQYLWDRLRRYPRGTRLVLGSALAARLYRSVLDRQVPVWREAEVRSLLQDGGPEGRVVGVQVSHQNQLRTVRARKAVVLATGGFPHNAEMRQRYFSAGAEVNSATPASSTGDGIAMALSAGGAMGRAPATPAFWSPVSHLTRADGSTYHYPHLIMDRSKPGLIAVNAHGVRFVNEALNYHGFAQAMLAQASTTGTTAAYLVATQAHLDQYCFGVSHPNRRLQASLVRQGYLLKADTLGELAQQMGVPADALAQTVLEFNTHAQGGADPDFGKGDSAYNRMLGDPEHRPNPCLAPLAQGPFYAIRLHPGDIGTCHGLDTDLHGRVLSHAGSAIPGLYACGNDMNSVMSGMYPGAGITLGPAIAFGYATAMHLARGDALQARVTNSNCVQACG
ncbi:FAD-dependent oxidoreductase [Hydrogenophaga sp. BPS33]|uniref:FAD-dependent oxidoreductase n=1 Tax=Hydrogenophaga sp. BPS33 TaxID=2651974 RepID=UPI00131FE17D|nr:FAD-dependent oxidoreductase [Hydrogenophaga sp. BPS33]QHE85470.1 FAD-dependent oxidoreductase [Hydrogenophaga sp. BPS33]